VGLGVGVLWACGCVVCVLSEEGLKRGADGRVVCVYVVGCVCGLCYLCYICIYGIDIYV
jgi:hypothetical protein